MLSADDWWAIMAQYGEAVWPAQVVLYLAAMATTLLVFVRPGPAADTVMRLYLGLAMGWTSIVFFSDCWA